MSGLRKEYPLILFNADTKQDIVVNSDKELIDLVSDELEALLKTITSENKDVYKLLYENVLWKFNIQDENKADAHTIQLADKRTLQLIHNFLYYNGNWHLAFDNKIWFDSVLQLQKIFEPMRLF